MHAVAGTAIIGIGLVIYGMLRGKIVWFTLIAAAAYVIVSILAGGIYPYMVQRFVVTPTELTRELPQLRGTSTPRARRGDRKSRHATSPRVVHPLTFARTRDNP